MLWAVCLAAELLAAVFVALLSRAERPLRLVALLCALFFFVDVEIMVSGLLLLDDAPLPFRGIARALYHIETALLLAQPFAAAASAGYLFLWPRAGRVTAAVVGLSWLVVVGALVLAYPLPIGWTRHALHAGILTPVVIALAMAFRARRRPWGRAHVLLFFVLGTLLAVGVIGPFMRGRPFTEWHFARVSGAIGFSVIAACCGAWLGGWQWKSPSSHSGRSSRSP